GEIDKQEALVDHKKIDGASFPRRGTGLDQALAVHEGIDQGGFPHVRTSSKRHFRERLAWVLCRHDGAGQKFCGSNLHREDYAVGAGKVTTQLYTLPGLHASPWRLRTLATVAYWPCSLAGPAAWRVSRSAVLRRR